MRTKGVFTMILKLNKQEYFDKVKGCWIGKNIGGTIGAPFEGTKEMPEINGYTTPKGEPLPNDDLDLQLVWLNALRDIGPLGVDANVLADYWMSHVSPHWGEYGVCKGNLQAGLLPPLSGEFENDWKNSNGAWIRSEIWACLCPGIPNLAVKYAIMDASVDHGFSEGTCAEIFTAALESLAFFESDLRKLIDSALSYLPDDCRVARSIRIVLECFENDVDWKEARRRVVEDNVHDLGWFMAPANVAFVVIGLLYGKGDFKKSMIITVGCGDDTDCTAATCGSVLGIIMGASGLPEDWKEYIGDGIITKCINASYIYTVDGISNIPESCTELTERVIRMAVHLLNAYGVEVELTNGQSECDAVEADKIYKAHARNVMSKNPLSFEINSSVHTAVRAEFLKEPVVKSGEEFTLVATVWNKTRESHPITVNVSLPDGWSAEYPHSIRLHNVGFVHGVFRWEMKVTPNENIQPYNRIYVNFESPITPLPLTVPFVVMG